MSSGVGRASGYGLHVSEVAGAEAAEAVEAVEEPPHTAPVLAVMVCHDGEAWLPLALAALRRSTVRPARIVAVDTGSADKTSALLTEAAESDDPVIDAALTVSRDSGFAAAVAAGVRLAYETFDDSVQWLWVLHDDSAPEPDCLAGLLNAADASPSAAVLGPLAVDWSDPRLVVEAGLSTDASGNRRNDRGLGAASSEGLVEQSTEVLAMPSAGALVNRQVWDELGGFDEEFALLREDLDFGWRANSAGKTVLCVPRARVRHARALVSGERDLAALGANGRAGDGVLLTAERQSGVRTFLLNCSKPSYLLGVPRLALLCFLRGLGLFLVGKVARARAEFATTGFLLKGHGQLRAGRARRAAELQRLSPRGKRSGVRGLFVGRAARLRYAARGAVLALVRRSMASDVALGRLSETTSARSTWTPPDQLRAAAFGGRTRGVVAVPLDEEVTDEARRPSPAPLDAGPAVRRPTPGAAAGGGLVFVEVDRKRILAATLLAPGLLLTLAMVALGLAVNWHRFGLDLTGGRLLPVGSLGDLWSAYLAAWHPAGGGTSAHAPAAFAVLGTLGAPLAPFGGPAALVALLFLLDIPLAALSAYAATRRLRVHRWVRALLAAGWAVLPPATAAVAQGRIDVVVVHVVLPLVVAGVASVLKPEVMAGRPEYRDGRRWLSTAVSAALGLALLGAFSPLVHVLVLLGLLTGFVFAHSTVRMTRRIAGVAVVALLPIALLLPWPIALVTDPELLLHGIGARVPQVQVSGGELFSLDPGGVGALPLGAVLVIAALVGLIVRPTARAVLGVGIVLLGAGAAAVVLLFPVAPAAGGAARAGWTGAPLLVVGLGLLCMLLAVVQSRPESQHAKSYGLPQRLAVGVGLGGVVVFAAAAVLVGRDGPLRSADTVQLAEPIAAELRDNGRSVLELRTDGDPPRMTGGGVPSFGDDDLPLPAGTSERLSSWQQVLLTAPGPPNAVRDTVASASAAGVQFVVLPPGVGAEGVIAGGGELVTAAPPLSDGRQVVRLKPTGGQVVLIAPELSKLAIGGKPPTGDIEGEGIAVVDAELPDVRLRVSDGPGGRLLVLAATLEAGWQAKVNGKPVPIVPAWGHQVGVEVPTRAADVVVDSDSTVRGLLLLGQIGAVLFTLLTAIPARRRGQSKPSGSMPR